MQIEIKSGEIKTLFLDIGGVLLTNGWDRDGRKRAVEKFNLDGDEVNERHHLTFDTYEEGKLTLFELLNDEVQRDFTVMREFLAHVVFYWRPALASNVRTAPP